MTYKGGFAVRFALRAKARFHKIQVGKGRNRNKWFNSLPENKRMVDFRGRVLFGKTFMKLPGAATADGAVTLRDLGLSNENLAPRSWKYAPLVGKLRAWYERNLA